MRPTRLNLIIVPIFGFACIALSWLLVFNDPGGVDRKQIIAKRFIAHRVHDVGIRSTWAEAVVREEWLETLFAEPNLTPHGAMVELEEMVIAPPGTASQ